MCQHFSWGIPQSLAKRELHMGDASWTQEEAPASRDLRRCGSIGLGWSTLLICSSLVFDGELPEGFLQQSRHSIADRVASQTHGRCGIPSSWPYPLRTAEVDPAVVGKEWGDIGKGRRRRWTQYTEKSRCSEILLVLPSSGKSLVPSTSPTISPP